jgi:type IV pilus assembly protein PilV
VQVVAPGPLDVRAAAGAARGFSMIELLIAVLVLAVGILGVAGLQITSLQQNRSALFRAEASQAAMDILDRIRANPDGAYDGVDLDDAPPAAPDCYADTCSVANMTTFDIASWKCGLNSLDAEGEVYSSCEDLGITGGLPGGAGAIEQDGEVFEVTVQWVDDRAGNVKSIVVRAQP